MSDGLCQYVLMFGIVDVVIDQKSYEVALVQYDLDVKAYISELTAYKRAVEEYVRRCREYRNAAGQYQRDLVASIANDSLHYFRKTTIFPEEPEQSEPHRHKPRRPTKPEMPVGPKPDTPLIRSRALSECEEEDRPSKQPVYCSASDMLSAGFRVPDPESLRASTAIALAKFYASKATENLKALRERVGGCKDGLWSKDGSSENL